MNKFFAIVVLLFLYIGLFAQQAERINLQSNFINPPNSAKPRTWMHAMSGNMSKAGMTKDLDALAAAGEGGVLLFNIANIIPYGRVEYNSAEHHEIIKHVITPYEETYLALDFNYEPLPNRALLWEHEGNKVVRLGKYKLGIQGRNFKQSISGNC